MAKFSNIREKMRIINLEVKNSKAIKQIHGAKEFLATQSVHRRRSSPFHRHGRKSPIFPKKIQETSMMTCHRQFPMQWPSPAVATTSASSVRTRAPMKIMNAAGEIKRLVLSPEGRTKLNPSSDRDFYSFPRFVTHVDDGFIGTLTELYRERLRPEFEVLDLMSSWVSHLPPEVAYKRVVGHGMNPQELARNPRLEYFFVKDLNKEQTLELQSGSFDAVICTVSVQYLQQPEKIFAEIFRVLKPGGIFIVSFSNRLFYEKAISAWRDGSAYSRVQLVVQYFQSIDGFTQPEIMRKLPAEATKEGNSPFGWIKGFLGLLSGSDPFYAVIAYKNFKPLYE